MSNTRVDQPDQLKKDDNIVEELITCSVSKQIFHTPVTLRGSGHTIEKDAADQILKNAQPCCPITRKPISGYDVNWAIKVIVDKFMTAHPDADQYKPTSIESKEEKKAENPAPIPEYAQNPHQFWQEQYVAASEEFFESNNSTSHYGLGYSSGG